MPNGRPTKYKKEYAKTAYGLALLGLTNEEIAEKLKIAESTFYLWCENYNKFSEAIKGGGINADIEVTQSLYKRAKGFTYMEKKTEILSVKEKGKEEEKGLETVLKTIVTKKLVIPDTKAAEIWLRNRQRKHWTRGDEAVKPDDGKPVIVNIINGTELKKDEPDTSE